MPRVSLVLSDVDGTLLDHDKVLTSRARSAVAALRSRGVRFAIVSGRPPRGLTALVEPLAIDTPVAAFNGGVIADRGLHVLSRHTISRDVAARALSILREHRLDPWIYREREWILSDASAPHVEREQSTVGFPAIVARDLDAELRSVVKLVGVGDDPDAVRACESRLQSACDGEASASRSQPYYVDVTHRDANKGAVVRYLARQLRIPPAEILTIGDGPNDVRMFEESGRSIAMGNASEEVRAVADAVTESCDREGFARAIEEHVLAGAAGGNP
ncbi:MAG: HAD family hydrolase [Gemmatimonadetes bacterium]|nr:HAD family hydrolase [Gemmatimonadota bacterium]